MRSSEELQYSFFLAKRLSYTLKFNFKAELETEENSDTDTWIIDEHGHRTPVQNVTSGGAVMLQAVTNSRLLKMGNQSIRADVVDHKSWISNVIEGKQKKKYSDSVNLVLLIHGTLPQPHSDEISQMIGSFKSDFGGIYYVCMPLTQPSYRYVVTLEKYWDTPDVF